MTSTAKTVLFWIMTFLTVVLFYGAAQHGSGGRVPNVAAKHIPAMRLGRAEVLMIFIIALIAFAPVLSDRQRFNALTTRLNEIFNKTFFVVLTVILAIFVCTELWLY